MTQVPMGQRFGCWVVIGTASVAGRRFWMCRCDCGTERSVRPSDLVRGRSTSCRTCRYHTFGWTDALICERLRPYVNMLGRMPSSGELVRMEKNESLRAAITDFGGMEKFARLLGAGFSGGTSHVGRQWQHHEESFFAAAGHLVVPQRTQAPFDLLVNDHRVDVKSASWTECGARGDRKGYAFGNLKKGIDCDLFDLVCIGEDGSVAARFIVPSTAARVDTLVISQKTLDGTGKYSPWRDRLDLLV